VPLALDDVLLVSCVDERNPNMIKRAILFLLTSSFLFAQAQGNPSLSGKWRIHLSIPGHDSDFYCTFTQNDQVLGGNCATEAGNAAVSGKFDGRNVFWAYTVKVSGQSITSNYSGNLDASGKVSGKLSLPGMPSIPGVPAQFPFTAAKSQ